MTKYTEIIRGLQVSKLTKSKRESRTLAYALYLQSIETSDNSKLSLAIRVNNCSSYWQGFKCPSCGRLHGMTTYGCHHRLCPICAVRKSRAVAAQAMQVIAEIGRSSIDIEYHLLTLTQKNVCPEELSDCIDNMLNAWSSLRYIRLIKNDLIGWARTIEITTASDGTYHPHIHCILMLMPKSILSDGNIWRKLWASTMSLNYIPICDCRPIKDIGAIYEVSKYVSKVSKLLKGDLGNVYNNVYAIGNATYKRRLRSYGGLWAKIRRNMRMVDVDSMDDGAIDEAGALLDAHNKCECGVELQPVCLMWAGMEYKEI